LRGQVAARLRGQVRPDVDGDHTGGQPGQQRGLVTIAGADLEDLFGARQARPSAAIIAADSDGWVVTCWWAMGMGASS
jgi:transcriptional regulator of acetoin/glycerol metabolism